MLTLEQVIEAVKNGRNSACIDWRDFDRLINFVPVEQWSEFGYALKEGAKPEDAGPPKAWTRENVIEQIRRDVAFGFEKALNQRGISSSLMFETVRTWMWVMEDDLQHFSDGNYAQYGLPLFKAVAVKYGFDNQIGDDHGDESKYASGGY